MRTSEFQRIVLFVKEIGGKIENAVVIDGFIAIDKGDIRSAAVGAFYAVIDIAQLYFVSVPRLVVGVEYVIEEIIFQVVYMIFCLRDCKRLERCGRLLCRRGTAAR